MRDFSMAFPLLSMTFAVFHDYPDLKYGLPKFHDFPGPVVILPVSKDCWKSSDSDSARTRVSQGNYKKKNRLILLDVAKTILKNSGNMLIAKPVTRQASVT